MNKNIFRSRTVIGVVCILLAVLVCFGITPLFNDAARLGGLQGDTPTQTAHQQHYFLRLLLFNPLLLSFCSP